MFVWWVAGAVFVCARCVRGLAEHTRLHLGRLRVRKLTHLLLIPCILVVP